MTIVKISTDGIKVFLTSTRKVESTEFMSGKEVG
jgi:hypothetical protein